MTISFLKNLYYRLLYFVYPISYKKTIWLIGSGRSGTTWVSSLINYNNTYREMFEPFHPYIPEMRLLGFKMNLYLGKRTNNKLKLFAKTVLRGKFYNTRVEDSNKFIRHYPNDILIVKDIFANLLAYEVCSKMNRVKPILLIRNPFAVALSIIENKWDWMTDPKEFLSQKELFDNYLKPFEELITDISDNGSELDKQLLIWSIINYIPLVQFTEKKLLVTFYENWLLKPEQELKRVHDFLEIPTTATGDINHSKKFTDSSRMSFKTSFDSLSWKQKISTDEMVSGMKILKIFGLDNLYDEFSNPNDSVIRQILRK